MAVLRASRFTLALIGAGLVFLSGCVVAPNGYFPAATYGTTGYYVPGYYGNATYYYLYPYYSYPYYPYYGEPSLFWGYYGRWGGSYYGRWGRPISRPGWWQSGQSRHGFGGGGMHPGPGRSGGSGSHSGRR
jgi:hypothetical protein